MLAHDFADGEGCFGGVVEGDTRDVVMHYMRFNGAVEDVASDPAEIAVDC